MSGPEIKVIEANFIGNHSETHGGAITDEGRGLQLIKGEFIRNYVKNDKSVVTDAANYKYQLNTPQQEREKAVVLDVLPDLLALSDHNQKQPPDDNKKQIVADSHTIINPDKDAKNP